jgi:hypothetical protein
MIWNLKSYGLAAAVTLSLCAASAWYGYRHGEQFGIRQVEIQWQEAMRLQANAEAEEVMKARQREQALTTLLVKQKMESHREAIRLANDYAAVVVSLQNRPDRPGGGGVPEGADSGAGAASGCTGAELYKSDAAVLVGIARDADELRLALKACITHTTQIERELNR